MANIIFSSNFSKSMTTIPSVTYTFLPVTLTQEILVSIQVNDRVWIFSIPNNECVFRPHFIQEEGGGEETTLHCVILYDGQVYTPSWFGTLQDSYGLLHYAGRVLRAVETLLEAFKKDENETEKESESEPEFNWEQLIWFMEAMIESLGLNKSFIQQFQQKLAQRRHVYLTLLKQVLQQHFLPYELWLVRVALKQKRRRMF